MHLTKICSHEFGEWYGDKDNQIVSFLTKVNKQTNKHANTVTHSKIVIDMTGDCL